MYEHIFSPFSWSNISHFDRRAFYLYIKRNLSYVFKATKTRISVCWPGINPFIQQSHFQPRGSLLLFFLFLLSYFHLPTSLYVHLREAWGEELQSATMCGYYNNDCFSAHICIIITKYIIRYIIFQLFTVSVSKLPVCGHCLKAAGLTVPHLVISLLSLSPGFWRWLTQLHTFFFCFFWPISKAATSDLRAQRTMLRWHGDCQLMKWKEILDFFFCGGGLGEEETIHRCHVEFTHKVVI